MNTSEAASCFSSSSRDFHPFLLSKCCSCVRVFFPKSLHMELANLQVQTHVFFLQTVFMMTNLYPLCSSFMFAFKLCWYFTESISSSSPASGCNTHPKPDRPSFLLYGCRGNDLNFFFLLQYTSDE